MVVLNVVAELMWLRSDHGACVLLVGKLWDENFGPIFCRMNRWADSRGEDPSELIRVGMLSDMGLFWVLTSAPSLPFAPFYPAVISATSESVSWRRGHADPDCRIVMPGPC